MPLMPAWGERGLLVAFTERGDLTILMLLYGILIVIEYLEMYIKIKQISPNFSNYGSTTS